VPVPLLAPTRYHRPARGGFWLIAVAGAVAEPDRPAVAGQIGRRLHDELALEVDVTVISPSERKAPRDAVLAGRIAAAEQF